VNDLVRKGVTGGVGLAVPAFLVMSWIGAAAERLEEKAKAPQEQKVAIASVAEDAYCTPELKAIVRRVAGACGLLDQSGGRGCQPMEAKNVAQLSDADFNALFVPLSKRAHIVQFDADQTELDEGARALVEKAWADQRGASFFFVVARASPDGNEKKNEELSAARAKAVLAHLQAKFNDPDLKKEVGLLWLGEGFAQLGTEFCDWQRSRTAECTSKEINRSAFVAWIDCAI
jgi:outer membrane protein OmpA-like peptidoglycan-associated protein